MLLERTISQLDTGPMPPDEAWQLGQLGYMQWLAGLPGGTDYRRAALDARELALPFSGHSLAVEAFCTLLQASADDPLTSDSSIMHDAPASSGKPATATNGAKAAF